MYVITGATGNTGSKIVKQLLEAGKEVLALGRDANKLQALADLGAKISLGELHDVAYLTNAFKNATAVYLLVPPKWDLTGSWREFQLEIGNCFKEAINNSGVKKVVLLSSIGAHLPEGAGPVSGLHHVENQLKSIEGLDILSLRAGYFMENLYGALGMINGMGIIGYSLNGDIKVPTVHTADIANAATKYLLSLEFSGFKVVNVPGARDYSMNEIAKIISDTIGKSINYVQFSYEDAKGGMIGAGLPEQIADGYNELFKALNEGVYLAEHNSDSPRNETITFEQFCQNEFKHAFN